MSLTIARIILRYAAGALAGAGLFSHDLGITIGMDEDVAVLLAAGLSAVAELAYIHAKRKGWAT